MKFNIEKRVTLKEMTVEDEITGYYAVIKQYFTKNQLCNDKGFSFYADVIDSSKVEKQINEDYYKKLSQAFKDNNGKPLYHSPSVIDGYNDKVVQIYTKKIPYRKSLLSKLDELIERKSFKKALNIIDSTISTLDFQVATYNDILKDTFVDKWNQSIQMDLEVLKQKVIDIQALELKKMESKEKRALNKLKKSYQALLAEKDKYSDAYFDKLLNHFCEEQGISIEYLSSL